MVIGARLHVIVDPGTDDHEAQVRAALEAGGVAGIVELVNANLEDVFVAATGFDGDAALPAADGSVGADEPRAGSDEVHP